MNKQSINFLAGMPRCGSTLLGSILNQNPLVNATPTSPLFACLHSACASFEIIDHQYTYDLSVQEKIYRGIIQAFHPDDREIPIIFEKHRGWPGKVDAIKRFITPTPKIICPVRPVAEVICSYLTLIEKDEDNFVDREIRAFTNEPITHEMRAHYLWTVTLQPPYQAMTIGMRMHPESLLLVEYDDLAYSPERTMQRVYEFCGMEPFEHDFEDVENTCAEAKDEAWGLKSLHDIRPTVRKTSVDPLCYLPRAAIDYFSQFDLKGETSWA